MFYFNYKEYKKKCVVKMYNYINMFNIIVNNNNIPTISSTAEPSHRTLKIVTIKNCYSTFLLTGNYR